ncbi:DDE-type integrase/transposase/recombinase [Devosia sp.]|uniref:DDE-type integrase/transposase/recombinase n=1 Tax=Devosia sp. TaxID=1871048 RepID=UPI0025B9D7DB|nr:DDE-type integrase/transposase/recombinase [Devosia sp.]
MNKLDTKTRAQILSLLVEGTSMRAVSRLTGVSINTVSKLLEDAGRVCAAFHSRAVQNVPAKRVQCDEIWSFVAAKQKNVPAMKNAPEVAGDVWTWTAIDADSKLIVSYMVGTRDAEAATEFMHDVAYRLASRVQLTTDGHGAYLQAVEGAFGMDVDYAMLVKVYGAAPTGPQTRYSPAECVGAKAHTMMGSPSPDHISTSFVERSNLSIRMHNRRFTRLTNAFSKKIDNHIHMLSLYFVFYNFCRIHKTLRVTPAMAAGISDTVRDMDWIVGMIDEVAPRPNRPTRYKLAKGTEKVLNTGVTVEMADRRKPR